jgi:hypothetical protein
VGSGGRRLRRPERGPKAQGSIGPCIRDGPPRKSYSGAGEPQDTACPRGENPGAERHLRPRSRRLVATTASQTTRGVREERRNRQVGPRRGNTTLTRGTAGSTLRRARKESHDRRRAATPAQVARTVAAGPVRHRETKPVTNDPPRRRLQRKSKERRREAHENRKGERGPVGAGPHQTPERDGPRDGNPADGTARPANVEGTDTRKPHESRPDEPARRGR